MSYLSTQASDQRRAKREDQHRWATEIGTHCVDFFRAADKSEAILRKLNIMPGDFDIQFRDKDGQKIRLTRTQADATIKDELSQLGEITDYLSLIAPDELVGAIRSHHKKLLSAKIRMSSDPSQALKDLRFTRGEAVNAIRTKLGVAPSKLVAKKPRKILWFPVG
ncbi:hypothetical protein [Paeniglutamicibacter sulfureus]|uniref:Uncharacterized protein n=1 Tax=Paeniglutamicibacter sulfureus TaxID=43666 RepID=A0ABU2BCS9_9MICC|nr:hypothetical protein [Paeniglutamicibacter sulfureus]MDR7356400.1 hypothetical protein [Paeniglutamicibacter sulfureus]